VRVRDDDLDAPQLNVNAGEMTTVGSYVDSTYRPTEVRAVRTELSTLASLYF
jgi:hypothetical protein